MSKIKCFLDSIPRATRADWARRHGMDPVRISQIAGGHKGIGLDYARKILAGAAELGAVLSLDDFFPHPDDGLPLDKRGLVSTQTNQEAS